MREVINNIQVHMPIRRLFKTERLQRVINKRINPEISFTCIDLETSQRSDFLEVAKRLSDAELTVTFHAPFMDLRPGAIDPKIRQATIDRLRQAFDLVPYFRPVTVVCHPSFDERYYVSNRQVWLENSIATWSYFIKLAEEMDTVITLENVYETDPEPLSRLLAAFTSPRIRFCFDTGHFNVFSRTPLEMWIEKLAGYLGQLHIHDNGGTGDDHLPVGEGNFPFTAFFAMLGKLNLSPLVTVESHSEEDLWKMLQNIKTMGLLNGMLTSANRHSLRKFPG
jgi:sugar phosphate isomerase/epimerase